MKITIITPYYDPNIVGGAEISTQLLAEGIKGRRNDWDICVITIGKIEEEVIKNDVKIHTIFPTNTLYNDWKRVLIPALNLKKTKLISLYYSLIPERKLVHKYYNIIKNSDFVIINTNEESFGRASLWKALSVSKCKTILTLRDPFLISKNWGKMNFDIVYRKIIKNQSNFIKALVAPSEYMMQLYLSSGFNTINRKVIYNAVDINRKSMSVKKKQIIYAGTITENKGVLTLLNAVIELVENRNNEIDLLYVGRGNLIRNISNHSYVHCIDWLESEKLYQHISESAVIVLPSEWPEAFGRTIVEGVFLGTLAIGSNAAAIPEVLNFDKRYIYVEKNHIDLANKIQRILELDEIEYCNELLLKQEEFSKFNKDIYISNWLSLIEELTITQN